MKIVKKYWNGSLGGYFWEDSLYVSQYKYSDCSVEASKF